jgi:hypothetical protein
MFIFDKFSHQVHFGMDEVQFLCDEGKEKEIF